MVDRVCFGERNPGEYGLFVSQPGVNVMGAADNQLIFSSSVRSMQAVQSGSLSVPVAGSIPTSVSLSYPNIGVIPVVIVFPALQVGNFGGSNTGANVFDLWITSPTLTSCVVNLQVTDPSNYLGVLYYCVMWRQANG